MTVREATAADVETLHRLAYESWPDAPFADVKPNDARIRESATWGLNAPDAKCWLLCDDDGLEVGVLGLLLTTHLFTGQRIGIGWWWWIRPESRNTSGLKLLAAAEEWAKSRGAVALQLVAPSAQFRALCERLHCRPIEMMYQKELV